MPRALSAQATAAVAARETGVIFLQTLDINLGNGTTLYVVNNNENITVNGQAYTAVGFQLDMPEETEDGFSTAKIAIDNVSQWLTPYLRTLFGPINLTVRIVTQSDLSAMPPDFNNVEFQSRALRLRDVTYDARMVRGTLYYNDTAKRRWPADTFTPNNFSGLF